MAFAPGHDVECCTGNVNRFMPYYVEQMWLSAPGNGLVASLYGPSSVSAKVGKNQTEIEIVEETNYPFSETINFKISTTTDVGSITGASDGLLDTDDEAGNLSIPDFGNYYLTCDTINLVWAHELRTCTLIGSFNLAIACIAP